MIATIDGTTCGVAPGRSDNPVALQTSKANPSGLTLQRIVVPIDFSGPSIEALQFAANLAQQTGATLLPIYVAEHVVYFDETITFPGQRVLEQIKAKLTGLARERVNEVVPVFPHVRTGRPWEEIAKFATQSEGDLIVIGTHGRTGLPHLLLGSTAQRVVQHATCPVLVFRPVNKDKAKHPL